MLVTFISNEKSAVAYYYMTMAGVKARKQLAETERLAEATYGGHSLNARLSSCHLRLLRVELKLRLRMR